MDKKWTVEIEGKTHSVEVDYGSCLKDPDSNAVVVQTDGKLVVDGNQVRTWPDQPREVLFEIDGKHGALRKKGGLLPKTELYIEGKQVKPDK